MSLDQGLDFTKFEAVLEDERMLPEHKQLVSELLSQAQQLQAENGRLRKAVLFHAQKGSRMSTKLKDALYE